MPVKFWQTIASYLIKVENILKGSLDLIPSPSHSVKIQIMEEKVCLKCKGKTLLGVVNKLLKTKHHPAILPIIWIFTECEGDGIESWISS